MTDAPRIITYQKTAKPAEIIEAVATANSSAKANGSPRANAEAPAPRKLTIVNAASFAEKPVPERQWLVPNMIPMRQVTLLSGDGSAGKTLLGLQLSIASATSTDWIGYMPRSGPALIISAEDEIEEFHRRSADICKGQGLKLDELTGLNIIDLADDDAIMAKAESKGGLLATTELYTLIDTSIGKFRPTVVIIDTLADTFGGDEIFRVHARQFVKYLKRYAMKYDCAVVLLAHPSLAGMASGSGLSGSTAWHCSVRSRIYLDSPTNGEEREDDNQRVLRQKKNNYGPPGGETALRWEAGRFVPVVKLGGLARAHAERVVDDKFLEILASFTASKRPVGDTTGKSYAPALFETSPLADGLKSAAFKAAMERLFEAKKIRIDEVGPPSRRRSRIVECD